ncbi:hypothetical protein DEJ50_33435 [Streptomyces venezuelae]|uniref:Uncharacterized protein n=1 Tax=Streptomyces venezuelae TaxID=54571 RepID=A0A5P2DBA4_STRVZ|nr:hypothetical protein [Streptomyces venezuelae]QES52003.1 hypothetical protein DEJ50_33435 [Streptomyces venezuelae]
MSWDVLLLRLPDNVTSVHELPGDHTTPPLGSLHHVLAAVAQVVPDADLSDPTWGEIPGPTWSMELNIGDEDPVDSIMLHIRGSGDDALTPVFRLAEALGCKVLDCAEGDLITAGQTSGWRAFQQFRDRVLRSRH